VSVGAGGAETKYKDQRFLDLPRRFWGRAVVEALIRIFTADQILTREQKEKKIVSKLSRPDKQQKPGALAGQSSAGAGVVSTG